MGEEKATRIIAIPLKQELALLVMRLGRAGMIMLCVTIIIAVGFRVWYPEKWIEFFIIPMLVAILSTLLTAFIGLPHLIEESEKRRRQADIGAPLSFWLTGTKSRTFHIVFGSSYMVLPQLASGGVIDERMSSLSDRSERNDPYNQRFGFHTIDAITCLRDFLYRAFPNHADVRLQPVTDILSENKVVHLIESGGDNIIVLGGCLSLPISKAITAALNTTFRQDADPHARKRWIFDTVDNQSFEAVIDYNNHLLQDYALVTRIVNRRNHNLLVVVAGNYAAGTTGGLLCLTQPEYYPSECQDLGVECWQWVVRSIFAEATDPSAQNFERPADVKKNTDARKFDGSVAWLEDFKNWVHEDQRKRLPITPASPSGISAE